MILRYLVRKINILLFLFIITGCSTVKNNMSNLNEVFFKEEVICPLIMTPEGSEELIAISMTQSVTKRDKINRLMRSLVYQAINK